MNTVTQHVVLKADGRWGSTPPAEAAGEVIRLLPPAIRYAIRMRFEGRSTVRGVRPGWLTAAADTRLLTDPAALVRLSDVQTRGPDTTMFFEVPPLGEAAASLYQQQEIWPTRPDPQDTGFDLLGDVVTDVGREDLDSEHFDNPLLRRIGDFRRALGDTFQSLDVISRRYPVQHPAELTQAVVDTARRFTASTPPSQPVRIYGKLDMIRASTQSFGLQLLNGDEVRGVADGFDVAELTTHFRCPVLVMGKAVYRPSGRLLRIDAAQVVRAQDDQKYFSKVPTPKQRASSGFPLPRPPLARNAVAAIFGQWPGDETDEEIDKALQEVH